MVLCIILSQLPFRQHSLWHSTPQRVEAGNVCTDQPARESINDNIAHCTSHPPAWRGWSILRGNNNTGAKQCWKSLYQPEVYGNQMVLPKYKITVLQSCKIWKAVLNWRSKTKKKYINTKYLRTILSFNLSPFVRHSLFISNDVILLSIHGQWCL